MKTQWTFSLAEPQGLSENVFSGCFLSRPSYVVPTSLSHGIKLVNPMFRGYAQQVGTSTQQVTIAGVIQQPDIVLSRVFNWCVFPKSCIYCH